MEGTGGGGKSAREIFETYKKKVVGDRKKC
jgi:hypothetical protein